MRRLRNKAHEVALAAMLALSGSADTRQVGTPEVKSTEDPLVLDIKKIRPNKNESMEDFGKRICESLGDGEHHIADNRTVNCHWGGGYKIKRWEDTPQGDVVFINEGSFSFPESPVPMKESELLQEVEGKDIVIFGENHDPDDKAKEFETEKIIYLLPELKEQGFTVVALEIRDTDQEIIDALVDAIQSGKDPNVEMSHVQALNYVTIDKITQIIEAAAKLGMSVKCIDHIDMNKPIQQSFGSRDNDMKEALLALVAQGNRVLTVVGVAHASRAKVVTFPFHGDKPRSDGGEITTMHPITPLYRRLYDIYAEQGNPKKITSIALDKCSVDVPHCY